MTLLSSFSDMGKFPVYLMERAIHDHVQAFPTFSQPCASPSTLHLFIPFVRWASLAYSVPVSSDTVIAIAFGLLSTIISLLGVFIGYLTLRAMPQGLHLLSLQGLLLQGPYLIHRKTQAVKPLNSAEYIATSTHTFFLCRSIRGSWGMISFVSVMPGIDFWHSV
jgi:hypothetical protein